MNVITLFSGYDSQCLALNRLGIHYNLVNWCEIDNYAITAHNALFPQYTDRNLGDITQVDWSKINTPIDLLTYSSPCQDFSNMGKRQGGEEGSNTRSSLLWYVENAIVTLRPKYLVFENVAAMVGKKFLPTFNLWQKRLQQYGYTNFARVLNAKDFNVPQNRKRIFMVSILDCDKPYLFPQQIKPNRNLSHIIEHQVDEFYYINDKRLKELLAKTDGGTYRKQMVYESKNKILYYLNGDKDGNASTVIAGHLFCGNIVNPKGGHKQPGVMEIVHNGYKRVRRLTEREYLRLMDVDDSDIDKIISTASSRSAICAMAGNSIVVSCLYHIFKNLLFSKETTPNTQLTLF